ncbi:MAG: DUF2795 domain-containing protein [Methanosarcinaceae archaeon]|nr:DUF2795 domain-containing protein [Methanosarcinaceae archaeon]
MKTRAAVVQQALKGIDYPKQKQEVIDYAKKHYAPQDIISELQKIPDRKYETASDLSKEFP